MFYGRCSKCTMNFRPYDPNNTSELVKCCPHCKSKVISFIDDPEEPTTDEQMSSIYTWYLDSIKRGTLPPARIGAGNWNKRDLKELLTQLNNEEDNGGTRKE